MRHDTRWYNLRLLLLRRVSHTLAPPNPIVPYLREAGFGNTVLLRDFVFDNSLITVFIERWRSETHTFHLPWGECTITLQDVVYHLRLRMHGKPLLGAKQPHGQQQGAQRKESFSIKLTWLWDRVWHMPDTADPATLQQYTKCDILLLIECYLMIDKSNNQRCRGLSWGSAVLAWMYYSLYSTTYRDTTDIFRGYTIDFLSGVHLRDRIEILMNGLDCIKGMMTLQMRLLSNC
ncbi:hypothetical protein Ahy_A06g030200 [Arachis hypogaea]|uniref:Aminotransferase-like plant mobile domain-containing protein n=1 Tax=Arachis hypogaea TaxID=3818 RepID=A0A445CVJ8_ARAHY|nr:hypothetical protein Ahy_A06g030200 [Arachis hypogaea]